jgi:tRNA dimethylallyltransferase
MPLRNEPYRPINRRHRPGLHQLSFNMMDRRTLIALIGPTGVGKTAVAIELAERRNGEIVSADSRQIYRRFDIGTGKPTPDQLARVRHHLTDHVDPDQAYTLAEYQADAYAAIEVIFARDHQPLLVGGTGLYIRAVTEGLIIPEVPPNPEVRLELEARAANEGGDALYAELQQIDPAAALKIDPRNVRRTIRALEVHRLTGRPFSELGRSAPPPFAVCRFGLTRPRAELYRRTDRRVDEMIARGWLAEVRQLAARYDLSLPAMSSLGYPEMGAVLRGEVTLETATQQIKHHTHRFVRHQYAWFRPADPRIRWLDLSQITVAEAVNTILHELDATSVKE